MYSIWIKFKDEPNSNEFTQYIYPIKNIDHIKNMKRILEANAALSAVKICEHIITKEIRDYKEEGYSLAG